ncbi:TerB family tellurite resistance protein [Aestuariibacter sp. AA17]|uniref:TerB family tellurite resistance protein n=1 Tax=Fluctibacter corallii TaxID=2984329 RepID=A0ABT3A926_9ALTE|nr:TerB family tellurite resistance protein [Aestuariibacter sp. AA17]MCV2885092.1 TerB family tellurite resistance protein [Aestuariibacter sp. AA17]
MEQHQLFNEALIKLCILMYQIDGKITLAEQDYLDELAGSVEWHGDMDYEDFLSCAIHEIREVIDAQETLNFISSLQDALSYNPNRVLLEAKGIAKADGDIVDEEQDIIDYLTNRVLARALRAQTSRIKASPTPA